MAWPHRSPVTDFEGKRPPPEDSSLLAPHLRLRNDRFMRSGAYCWHDGWFHVPPYVTWEVFRLPLSARPYTATRYVRSIASRGTVLYMAGGPTKCRCFARAARKVPKLPAAFVDKVLYFTGSARQRRKRRTH